MQTEALGIISEQLMIFSCLRCSAAEPRGCHSLAEGWLNQERSAPALLNSALNDFVFFFFLKVTQIIYLRGKAKASA